MKLGDKSNQNPGYVWVKRVKSVKRYKKAKKILEKIEDLKSR